MISDDGSFFNWLWSLLVVKCRDSVSTAWELIQA